jgi:putative ABC transport system permease protein
LVSALIAGFVVAVAMVVSIPLYADAIGYRALRAELVPDTEGTQRPPFAFMFSHVDPNDRPLPPAAFQAADTYFKTKVAGQLGMPLQQLVRYANSDKLSLFPQAAPEDARALLPVNLSFAEGIEDKVDLLEGRLPAVSSGGDAPAEVMIHWQMAEETGTQLGEHFLVEDDKRRGEFRLPVEVVGVWGARDPLDPYWFIHPDSLKNVLLVPEQTYASRVLPQGPKARAQTIWYLTLNGDRVRNADVPGLIRRISQVTRDSAEILPGVQLPVSPRQGLEQQHSRVRLLTVSLTVFSLPILALIGYFIVMIASLVVQRQQSEVAVLRSRGASRTEILGIYLLEGVLLGSVALVLGTLLGPYTATLMGWTRSFLSFVPRDDVTVALSDDVIRVGLWVILLMIVASVVPALGSSSHTIISYKQERARSLGRPFWQRMYLDVLLLVPAWYGYSQLKVRGTINILGQGGAGGDPFSNPLLVLAPMLSQIALALVSLRLFPLLMSVVSWGIGRLPGVSALLALRYLTRSTRAYIGPVLLLILTVSLATFTASMAETLDSHLHDQVHYDVGTEIRISDFGQDSQRPTTPGAAPAERPLSDEPRWQFLPVTEYLRLPGVTAATRVTRSEGEARTTEGATAATVLGIDRLDFPNAAHWRDDYASQSLGALMNALGANPAGVLASRNYLAETGLGVGDRLAIELNDVGEPVQVPFFIVGVVDLFPSVYREDGPFFVANAEYLFEQEGDVFPYEVWLNVTPETTPDQLRSGINSLRLPSIISQDAPDTILVAQERPERQGLYGLLSVGFLGSALLTGLGFLFYALVSFQQRFIELGMLRAIGLSIRQMLVLLIWEQLLIIGTGIVMGTAIGVWVSRLYIPFLQVGGEHAQSPPFIVRIAWDQVQIIYLIFTVLMVLALSIVAAFLIRMKIFQAIKLGEAV